MGEGAVRGSSYRSVSTAAGSGAGAANGCSYMADLSTAPGIGGGGNSGPSCLRRSGLSMTRIYSRASCSAYFTKKASKRCILVRSRRITAFIRSPKPRRKASGASAPLLKFVSIASASASVSPIEVIIRSLSAFCASTARRLPETANAHTTDATTPPAKKPTKSILMPPPI
ncbi:hypothetical protein R80B4_01209 [Fibrobacteres bacterium R8-0-B4]